MMPAPVLLHATAVAIGRHAVLLTGRSGAGKSDLALRLVDRGAVLVADDYVALAAEAGCLVARAPATIAGKIEVRGVGIVDVPYVASAPVALVVDLDLAPDRLPEPRTCTVAGVAICAMRLNPFEASAPLKVELALSRAQLSLEGSCR